MKNPKRVRYRVGQPMGSLSSWPVMAISHHYLVRFAFAASGYLRTLKRAPYSLLGDDLTLEGHGVADTYLDLISCLGMEYSPDKTYIANGVAEFAKSLFCQGEDLTPFPLALLRYNDKTIVSNTLTIITECHRRKIPVRSSTLLRLFPRRWRKTVLLAALSPSSPRFTLDLQPRENLWIFQQFLLKKRLEYFVRKKTVHDSTYAFSTADTVKFGRMYISPYLQIAMDNGKSYPVRHLDSDFYPIMMIGSN